MTNIDLYEISIERYDRKDAHTGLTVTSINWDRADVIERYRFVERVAAANHVAGVLARLAAELADDMLKIARRCGCSGQMFSGCKLLVSVIEPVYQVSDDDDEPIPGRYRVPDHEPVVELCVPTAVADEFVMRIERLLEQIAEYDAIEFTDESELRD